MRSIHLILYLVCIVVGMPYQSALAKTSQLITADDILGKYKIVGRETAQVRAIVEAKKDRKGKYYFQIVNLNKKAMGYQERCIKCPGKFKNKKLKGLIIAWNLAQSKKNPREYNGAFGFDPWSGKRFQGSLKLSGSKNILYITARPPETRLLSRKLKWLRVQ